MFDLPSSKLIVINTTGVAIPELGNIYSPITEPTMVPLSSVISMVTRGLDVVEVNPRNKSERVSLNLRNVSTINFISKPKSVVQPEAVKVEKDVVQETQVQATTNNKVKSEPVTDTKKAANTNSKATKVTANDFTK